MPMVLVDTLAALISALTVLALAFTAYFVNKTAHTGSAKGDEHLAELLAVKNKELEAYMHGLIAAAFSQRGQLPPPKNGH